ncbi:VWA domain-containing protein [Candidatus Poribacteria bacterium]|nr:VWA domain-containing protein [Candidatus Poribacteria bacterium]MYG08260.1 VWA domain-containing protein [Candidatus Poribacteria bacterium]MYK20907.1 VWA domain-containing protein [Candidatus Poribacteria bacterium]
MLTIVSLQHAEGRTIPLKIDRYHTRINIKNQLATTKVDQTFVNPNSFEVNGMYIFPVPDDAVVSNLALSINGKSVSGELLSQEQSHRIYRDSARYGGNKAILEHLGTRAFVVEVPGIPASGERRIQFAYSQVISADSDLTKYTYPLSLAKSASGLIGNLHIEMEIESEHELRAIHSPSYEVTIDRKDDHHVCVSYEGTDVDPDDDFLCYYSVSDDNFGITLLTHRADEKEDGYFMLLISPKYEVKQTEIIEKDFVFVLDRSGSMSGRKVEQAKEALRYCVQNLNDGDRFNLILFNEDITSLADRLNRGEEWFGGERWSDSKVLSDKLINVKDGREKAFAFIDGVEGRGMTNINDALLTALAEKPDPKRPRIIVFLTDGCPTVGVTNPARILENVAKVNKNLSRIFVFGVGYDINDHLLDKMAADNGGTRNYVTPDENIEDAVSSLFRKMNEPVLVDVRVNFGQIITKELTPKNLPDLFREEQLTILGRYEGHGDTVLKLRGIIGSEQHEFSKNVLFSELEMDNDFLPHLWAQGKIAELVDQAALGDGSAELYKEIKRLSEKYGIPTPYTSFVDADDGSLRKVYDDSRISDAYTEAIPIHERIKINTQIEKGKMARFREQHADTKYIGGKAFHRHGKIWVDSEYDGKSDRKQVEFGSDEHFTLINQYPDLAKYDKFPFVIICYKGVTYEITPPTV